MKTMLFVATPCFAGQMHHLTHRGLSALHRACDREGVGYIEGDATGISIISRARDELAHQFLKTTATHLLWVDADILFRWAWVLEMIAKDVSILGGAYPKKELLIDRAHQYVKHGLYGQALEATLTEQACVPLDAPKPGGIRPAIVLEGPKADMFEVKYLPTGFLLLKREVFRDMINAHPELMTRTPGGEPVHALHLPLIDPVTRQQLGEDYSFLYRARELGHRVLCYEPAKCAHVGTYVYRGQNFEPASVKAEIDDLVCDLDAPKAFSS